MDALQRALGYVFSDAEKLRCALTHSSFVFENNAAVSNERLEFLGDAVLELTVSDYLFARYPALSEGELTKRRAAFVCEAGLAAHARRLSLGAYLRLGRGEVGSGGAEKPSILSDALEAVIGAVYLDGGFKAAQDLVCRLLAEEPPAAATAALADAKTALQERIQKNSREAPVYDIVDEEGPAHQKRFTATVSHEGRVMGTGVGKTKKEAEQAAAAVALGEAH